MIALIVLALAGAADPDWMAVQHSAEAFMSCARQTVGPEVLTERPVEGLVDAAIAACSKEEGAMIAATRSAYVAMKLPDVETAVKKRASASRELLHTQLGDEIRKFREACKQKTCSTD